jgi:hypothetical protein
VCNAGASWHSRINVAKSLSSSAPTPCFSLGRVAPLVSAANGGSDACRVDAPVDAADVDDGPSGDDDDDDGGGSGDDDDADADEEPYKSADGTSEMGVVDALKGVTMLSLGSDDSEPDDRSADVALPLDEKWRGGKPNDADEDDDGDAEGDVPKLANGCSNDADGVNWPGDENGGDSPMPPPTPPPWPR